MRNIPIWTMFQFLIVRLKYDGGERLAGLSVVSIPYSTIKIYK